MSNFQIHELSTGALDRNSNLVHDTEVSTDVWNTRKATAGAVADLALEVVASEYDDTASYAIGSYCIYSGVLYRCTTATTGAFDVSDWIAVLVTDEYKRVRVMHKADFDLLTPEEQADGMIFVDDVDITADDISYAAGVSVADKLDSLSTANDFIYNQEVKVGRALINGNTVDIYRYIATGTKSTASWGSAISNLPLDYGKVIKTLFSCKNSSGDNICSPYYVGSNDLFRAAVQKNGSQTDIYAQLGTSYPSMPATVIAEIYYYK